MGKSISQAIDDGNQKLLKLTEIMSNYITLLTPPEKLQSEIQSFFQERSKHEEALLKQNLTIQELQNQVLQIPKLEQTIEMLQNKVQGLENTIESVSESQSVKDLNVQLQSQLTEKDSLINNLTQEMNMLKSNSQIISQKAETIPELTLNISQLQNKLAGMSQNTQELRQTLQKERETIQTLTNEKKGLEYALRRLERRLTAKGSLRGLSIPIHELEISEDIANKADVDIQQQIKTMNLELQKRLNRIKELEIRNNDLKTQLAQSSDRDLRLQIDRLNSELDARKGTIMGMESSHKKLMEQIESQQQRLADLQNKIMELGKELEEKNKNIKNLEEAVSSGIHDQHAREVIENLQQQNRDLRNEVRESEKVIRSFEKNIKFYQTEMKNQKDQAYKLYNQNKDQAVLIQKLETALRKGGSTVGIDIQALETAKQASFLLSQDGPSLDDEIRERDRKITRLESYANSLKQEIEDIQFRISSRDVKIDELNNILKELKNDLASSKSKIIIRPPSTDEYRKTKVKI